MSSIYITYRSTKPMALNFELRQFPSIFLPRIELSRLFCFEFWRLREAAGVFWMSLEASGKVANITIEAQFSDFILTSLSIPDGDDAIILSYCNERILDCSIYN